MEKKGFTLVELLVVLVIIGIIIALILPNTLRAIQEANERECASNIRAIETALQLCYTSERDWDVCASEDNLTDPDDGGEPYLDQPAVCPFDVDYVIGENANTGGNEVTNKEGGHFDVWPPRGENHL